VVARDIVGRPDAEESILKKPREDQMAKTATKNREEARRQGTGESRAKQAAKAAARPATRQMQRRPPSAGPEATAKATAPKGKAKPAKKAGVKLSMLSPVSTNMTFVCLRARGQGSTIRDRRLGHTRSPEYMARNPAHLTPMIEDKGLRVAFCGELRPSCSISPNKHGLEKFYPKAPAKRRWSTAPCST